MPQFVYFLGVCVLYLQMFIFQHAGQFISLSFFLKEQEVHSVSFLPTWFTQGAVWFTYHYPTFLKGITFVGRMSELFHVRRRRGYYGEGAKRPLSWTHCWKFSQTTIHTQTENIAILKFTWVLSLFLNIIMVSCSLFSTKYRQTLPYLPCLD